MLYQTESSLAVEVEVEQEVGPVEDAVEGGVLVGASVAAAVAWPAVRARMAYREEET